jgi:hypothetical protein
MHTGISFNRIKYAHLSEAKRERMACLSAHGMKDLAVGYPKEFCIPIYKREGLMRKSNPRPDNTIQDNDPYH